MQIVTEPFTKYLERSKTHLTSGLLRAYMRDPYIYSLMQQGQLEHEETAALSVGSALHCLVLEGREAYGERFFTGGPINPTTGKAFGRDSQKFKDWATQSEQQGRTYLSEDEMDMLTLMGEAIHCHKEAGRIVKSHKLRERTIINDVDGVPCQVRLDAMSLKDHTFVELKTCQSLDHFHYDIGKYGYHLQHAFYGIVSGYSSPNAIVAVEKSQPHRVGVWHIPHDAVTTEAVRLAIQNIKKGEFTGKYEKIQEWKNYNYKEQNNE